MWMGRGISVHWVLCLIPITIHHGICVAGVILSAFKLGANWSSFSKLTQSVNLQIHVLHQQDQVRFFQDQAHNGNITLFDLL